MKVLRDVGYLAAFLVGLVIRAVPEAIAYPAPIGYNIVAFYAPGIRFLSLTDTMKFFYPPQFSPLVYVLLIPFNRILSPYTLLSIFSIILYGILTLTVYRFLRVEGLPDRAALLGSLFVAIQFPVLRLSWDMPAEVLAISIGILVLSLVSSRKGWSKYLLVGSLLVVAWLAHQVVLLSLLPCVFYEAYKSWRKSNLTSAVFLFASTLPALLFMGWNVSILQGLPTDNPVPPGVRVWFLTSNNYSAGISPFANYLLLYGSYAAILLTVVGFLLYLYVPLLPALAFLRKKSGPLAIWSFALTLMAISPVFSPTFALDLWYIWAFLISVPLCLIAVPGFIRLLKKARQVKPLLLIVIIGGYAVLGAGFMVLPPQKPFIYFYKSPFLEYAPSSMLANTVPLQDSLDALSLLTVLNSTIDQRSVLLVHDAFYGFAALTFSGDKNIIDYNLGTAMSGVSYAEQLGFQRIYWIWWTPGYGWFGVPNPPKNFDIAFQQGHVAIYLYQG
jgi:hypothetical protein